MEIEKRWIIISGYIGLLAAMLVGTGEFLLHYDPQARFSEANYDFMQSASDARQTIGHFFGVLGAPLYVVGCWHIYLMLKPANRTLALVAFLVSSYGFMIGAITHLQQSGLQLGSLVDLYHLRYESLLTVIRITTLLLSLIIIYLVIKGKTHYSKWMAFFNPMVLLLFNFVVYLISPAIGKFMMPIALNIGFGLFFILSISQARNI